MTDRIQQGGLQIAPVLYELLEADIAPGTGVTAHSSGRGWKRSSTSWRRATGSCWPPRDNLQAQIDAWHRANPGAGYDRGAYKAFLREIGYLLPEGEDFAISTENVDPEVATLAGPQLVVPVMNARYALNAANARWGSLYDALYGTDVIPEDGGAKRSGAYNPVRGAKVIAYARDFLDRHCPLATGGHAEATLLHRGGGQVAGGAGGRHAISGLRGPRRNFAATAASPMRPPASCCATTACTSRSRSTRAAPSAAPIPPASRTWCWRRR